MSSPSPVNQSLAVYRNSTESRPIPDDFARRRPHTDIVEWSNQQSAEGLAVDALPSTAPLGALRAVLAAAERLGVERNALLAAAEIEAARLDAADRAALARLRAVAEEAATEFVGRVRATIAKLVREGRVGAEDVAKALAVSVRTLHRRLEKSGTTFGGLCDEARCSAALAHLRDPKIPIKETASLLGFSEPSTFYRAFRRWTGDTPAHYRRVVAS